MTTVLPGLGKGREPSVWANLTPEPVTWVPEGKDPVTFHPEPDGPLRLKRMRTYHTYSHLLPNDTYVVVYDQYGIWEDLAEWRDRLKEAHEGHQPILIVSELALSLIPEAAPKDLRYRLVAPAIQVPPVRIPGGTFVRSFRSII